MLLLVLLPLHPVLASSRPSSMLIQHHQIIRASMMAPMDAC